MSDELPGPELEARVPTPPVPHHAGREAAFQVLAACGLGLGLWYLHWRWTASLNWDAPWFSLPLAVAETLAFVGAALNTYNLWATEDPVPQAPPARLGEIQDLPEGLPDRPLSVDLFFPTYSEDPELVRLSLQDAKRLDYPHPIELKIWVLDDGRRPAMRQVADEEGVGYLTRSNNVGFKAGNLHNALGLTSGDLVVICDADTRPLPGLLAETLGHFRDPQVAWVQTPQWFYDIPKGLPLAEWARRRLGRPFGWAAGLLERVVGPLPVGKDPFGNDPQMFFDVIQRRRHRHNASFCCGATSLHRREAVMMAALKEFATEIDHFVTAQTQEVKEEALRQPLVEVIGREALREVPVMPYRYHVSEDIYTSLLLHADREHGWRSVFYPKPLSRMLSPQDMLAFTLQRFKYAGGTLDIAKHHNPLFLPGLSLAQRLLYFTTVYSYFAWTWIVVFLAAPIVYGFTGVTPLASYGVDFYAHALPFLVVNRLAFMLGTWGIDTKRGEEYYVASFHLQMRAFWTVLRGEQIKFPVTPKVRQAGNFLALVQPHLLVFGLTLAAWCFHALGLSLGWFVDPGAFLVNTFWSFYNLSTMGTMIQAARWSPPELEPHAA